MLCMKRALAAPLVALTCLACGSDGADDTNEPTDSTEASDADGGATSHESDVTATDEGTDESTDSSSPDGGQDTDVGTQSDGTDSMGEPEMDGGAQVVPEAGVPGEMEPVVAEWPSEGVTLIELDRDGHAELSSSFEGAEPLGDLDWARDPDIACWNQSTADEFFSASHVAFALADVVPQWSEVTIDITPEGNGEANVYVIEMPASQADVPPAIDSATFCSVPIQRGSPGAASQVKLRTYGADAHILFGVSNRGRFNGDDTAAFDIAVQVTQLDDEERCYDHIEQPLKYPSNVELINLASEGSTVLSGNLAEGAPVCDDAFIDDQFCAPETRVEMFGGNHRFYAIDPGIADHTVVNITVTPDPGVDISLYSTLQGETSYYVPPNLISGICDASYHATFPGAPTDSNPGEAESLMLNAINNPYNVFFAVAGTTEQGASGGYTIGIEAIDTSTSDCTEDDINAVLGLEAWPSNVTTIAVETTDGEGSASLVGDLADGESQCTLDWAANSSVACFPLTQRDYFDGNHVFYALQEPPPPGSAVTFRVIPEPGVEVSAYAYRIGTQNFLVPPFVPSVVQCEASHNLVLDHSPNPGVVEEVSFYGGTNAYNYFLAVAGYSGGEASGAYEVQVEITEPPPPHCPQSLPGATYASWPTTVELIAIDEEGTGSSSGDLSQGECKNLSFADDSSVACFPSIHFDHFEGNHVQYALAEPLPPNSEVTVTVTPDGDNEINVYGFQTGTTSFPVPPNVPSVPVCEASYDPGDPNPGEPESIYFANPTGNSYNISFVVAGDATTGDSGGYDISVQMNVAEPHCEESLPGESGLTDWPSSVEPVALDADGLGSVSGDLGDGNCLNLEWASNSSVACFPETQFDNFEGGHVMYALEDPIPPNSILSVTLRPADGVDANLYGYQIGEDSYMVPPAVPSVVACEASYPYAFQNPGEAEKITFYNPSDTASYNVFFGVAGARDIIAGAFDVDVQLITGTTHCEESLPGQSHSTWPGKVQAVPVDGFGNTAISGDLATGACVNLAFASDSSVACFPATQNASFEGNHVFYSVELPGVSQAIVSLTSGNDIANLYAYLLGDETYFVPPHVPSTIACEASVPPFANPEDDVVVLSNPTDTPRNVFFAVAGEAGEVSGSFDVNVEVAAP